ncbi:MAG: hypothetical protein Q8920_01895 [Bacillota bacterium]|nr:hypothetical protein [Bacillota bacterium]
MNTPLILIAVFVSGLVVGIYSTLMTLRFVNSVRRSMKRKKSIKASSFDHSYIKTELKKVS